MATTNVDLVEGADWVLVSSAATHLVQNMGNSNVLFLYSGIAPSANAPYHGLQPWQAVMRADQSYMVGNLYAKSSLGAGKLSVSS